MHGLRMTEDVVSLTELRSKLTEKIEGLSEGSGYLVVTRNGRPAAVILSPEEYDRLQHECFVRTKLARGLSEVAAGHTTPHDEVMAEARRAADAEADADADEGD